MNKQILMIILILLAIVLPAAAETVSDSDPVPETKEEAIAVPEEPDDFAAQAGEADTAESEEETRETGPVRTETVPVPEELRFRSAELVMGKGNSLDLTESGILICRPKEAAEGVIYSTSSPSVVRADVHGNLKAVGTGTAVISVYAPDGTRDDLKVRVKAYPSSMKPDRKSLILGRNMETDLKISFGRNTYSLYRYSSSDPEVAAVDPETGHVEALSPGTAVITCACVSGKKKCTTGITVYEEPDRIEIKDAVLTGYVGQTGLAVKASCPVGTYGDLSYGLLSGEGVVVPDEKSGALTLLSEGEAVIRVTAGNAPGVIADCRICVSPAPESVGLREPVLTIGKGNRFDLIAEKEIILLPERAGTKLKFTSSNAKLVKVSSDGVITALKTGNAKVTVRTHNGLKAAVTVRVLNYPKTMKLVPSVLTLSEGMTGSLSVEFGKNSVSRYIFSSSDPEIVAVDAESGKVEAMREGTAKVTCACTTGTKKAVCTVKVLPEPTEVTISPSSAVIAVGDSLPLKAELNMDSPGSVRFESLDPDQVRIDPENGLLTAVGIGTGRIRAVSYNGLATEAVVTVTEGPKELILTDPIRDEEGQYRLSLHRSDTFRIRYDMGILSSFTVSFESEDPQIASVDETGSLTAHRSGETRIIVRSYSGLEAVIRLNVWKWTDGTPMFVSHAMGGIEGKAYSNSLEAFQQNYAEGHRLFEVDLVMTADGELVLWHGWEKQICSKIPKDEVPTLQQFMNARIYDRYTPLSYTDLLRLMQKYPDIRVIIDTKDPDEETVRRNFAYIVGKAAEMNAEDVFGRIAVEIYTTQMLDTVEEIHHFDTYIMLFYRLFRKQPTAAQFRSIIRFAASRGIDLAAIDVKWWKPSFIKIAREYDVDIAVHTVNDAQQAEKLFSQGIKMIATDFLGPYAAE